MNTKRLVDSILRQTTVLIAQLCTAAGISEQDRELVAAALERVQIDSDDSPEPVSNTFVDFAGDVDLVTAAGELLLSAEELRDNLQLLDPALGALDGGSVSRSCVLSAVLDNQPDPVLCENPRASSTSARTFDGRCPAALRRAALTFPRARPSGRRCARGARSSSAARARSG